MKHGIKYLPAAVEDLATIEDWYRLHFDDGTALKVVDSILTAVSRLEDFPDSGSLPPDEWLVQNGFKMIIAGRHVAIYKKVGDDIYIYHIADTRTEYEKLFYDWSARR